MWFPINPRKNRKKQNQRNYVLPASPTNDVQYLHGFLCLPDLPFKTKGLKYYVPINVQ
jgi:hypothetical protein